MTVKFDLYLESLSSANHLTERNIRLKLNKIIERVHEIESGPDLKGKYHILEV